jgi:hypothetical protein
MIGFLTTCESVHFIVSLISISYTIDLNPLHGLEIEICKHMHDGWHEYFHKQHLGKQQWTSCNL